MKAIISILITNLALVISTHAQATHPMPNIICTQNSAKYGKVYKLYLRDINGYRQNYQIDLYLTTNTVANKGKKIIPSQVLSVSYIPSGMQFQSENLKLRLVHQTGTSSGSSSEIDTETSTLNANLETVVQGHSLRLQMGCGVALGDYPQQ